MAVRASTGWLFACIRIVGKCDLRSDLDPCMTLIFDTGKHVLKLNAHCKLNGVVKQYRKLQEHVPIYTLCSI